MGFYLARYLPTPRIRAATDCQNPNPVINTAYLVLSFLDHVPLTHVSGRRQRLLHDWGALDVAAQHTAYTAQLWYTHRRMPDTIVAIHKKKKELQTPYRALIVIGHRWV